MLSSCNITVQQPCRLRLYCAPCPTHHAVCSWDFSGLPDSTPPRRRCDCFPSHFPLCIGCTISRSLSIPVVVLRTVWWSCSLHMVWSISIRLLRIFMSSIDHDASSSSLGYSASDSSPPISLQLVTDLISAAVSAAPPRQTTTSIPAIKSRALPTSRTRIYYCWTHVVKRNRTFRECWLFYQDPSFPSQSHYAFQIRRRRASSPPPCPLVSMAWIPRDMHLTVFRQVSNILMAGLPGCDGKQ